MKIFLTVSIILGLVSNFNLSSVKTITKIEMIENEVRKEFENDFQFQLHLKEDSESAEKMIAGIIDSRETREEQGKVSILGGTMGEAYATVPFKEQINSYYCGPASILQSLYGMKLQGKVSGSGDSEKQKTLGASMGTEKGAGTYVYRMVNELNKYVSTSKYRYRLGSDMSRTVFDSSVANSLMVDRPVILHARTGHLSYYNGHNVGHYISLDYINRNTNRVKLVDPHYSKSYQGRRTVPTSEAFSSISKESSRYLIYHD